MAAVFLCLQPWGIRVTPPGREPSGANRSAPTGRRCAGARRLAKPAVPGQQGHGAHWLRHGGPPVHPATGDGATAGRCKQDHGPRARGETGCLLQRLCERSLDLVICRSQLAPPELQNQEVMNEPWRVALPPQHPWCGQAQTPLGTLHAERFLLHSALLGIGISDMLLRACQEAGVTPEVAYWGVEALLILLMVQKGLGVTFLPQQLCPAGRAGPARAGAAGRCQAAHAPGHDLAVRPCAAPGGRAAQGTHPGAVPAAAHLRTGQGPCAGAWGLSPSP